MKRIVAFVISMVMLLALVFPSWALKTVPIKNIKFDKSSLSLDVGKTYTFKVTLTPQNTTQKTLKYSTSNRNIISVDAKGKIKAIKAGNAIITATSSFNPKIKTTCKVTVSMVKAYNPAKITFWTWDDNNNGMTNLIQGFNAQESNVKAKLEIVTWANFHDKLFISVAAGSPPDVSGAALAWVPEFVGMKALEPLDAFDAKWTSKREINQSLLDIQRGNYDALYSLPCGNVVYYLYCRKDLFDQQGVAFPTTIDEFYDACRKMTLDTNKDGATDVYGFGMRGARMGHLMWLALTFGDGDHKVKFYDNTGKLTLNDPQLVAATAKYIDLYKKGYTPKTAPKDGYTEIVQNFLAGKTAMLVHTIGSKKAIVEKWGDKVTVVPIPRGKAGSIVPLDITCNVMFKTSKNKEAAFKLMDYICSPDGFETLVSTLGQVPYQKSLAEKPVYKDDLYMKVSMDSIKDAFVLPPTSRMGVWTEMTWPAEFQKALLGESTPEQFIEAISNALK